MAKGFLKIPVDGKGDMIINTNDISHIFVTKIPNTGITQVNVILKTLGEQHPLRINTELEIFEERLNAATA